MAAAPLPVARWQSLYWLALGAFAIGTEGFMIAGLLPDIANDVGVSIEAAGQLVTLFALSYALSSPILTTLAARVDRRLLLIAAMAGFCAGNLVAATASGYWGLAAARVLLALAAGVYIPTANALASTLFAPEFRGRALAVVNGGTTIAIALGVPLGALVGDHYGWRMTFFGVGVMSLAATAGLLFGLPARIGANTGCVTIGQRLQVLRQRTLFGALLMTTLWSTGSYTVYTYLATEIRQVLLGSNTAVSVALFVWGACAALGVWIGGRLNDAIGSRAVILPALFVSAFSLFALSGVPHLFAGSGALVSGVLVIGLWGAAAWAVHPSQMARLIGLAGAASAPVVLSLNASFLYVGFAAGAALGSLVMAFGAPADLGWVGGTCQVLAVWVAIASRPPEGARRRTRLRTPAGTHPCRMNGHFFFQRTRRSPAQLERIMKLSGNTILITGGGSGIGKALAESFHKLGNQVIISGRRKSHLDATVAANPGMVAVEMDVADPRSIAAVAKQLIGDFPKLNILINNAGIMQFDDASAAIDEDVLQSTIATNLLGPIRLTSALIEHLKKQPDATVLNVSSVLAFVPLALTAVYSSTKAAIHSYSQSLRWRLKGTSVTVREIAPPWVQTELLNSSEEPRAMPLVPYITETMALLATDANEVIVDNAKAMRAAVGPDNGAFANQFNDVFVAG